MTDTLAAASKRADATDAKVNQLVSVWDATRGRFVALESLIRSNLQSVGKETRTLVNQMQRRIGGREDVDDMLRDRVNADAGHDRGEFTVQRIDDVLANGIVDCRQACEHEAKAEQTEETIL